MADGTWPNLFVAGVERGGTTSLWRYLDQHPNVFMTTFKETHFFSSWTPPWRAVKDKRAYLALFADADAPWRGEASPSYIWDEQAPARIADVSPDARFVISLREPVGRAYSAYWMMVSSGYEDREFSRAVQDELALRPRLDGDNPWQTYVDRGLYAARMERYLDTFGDRVHVLFFEDLQADPRREVRSVFEFLGVDPGFADDLTLDAHNTFAQPRGGLSRRLLGSRRGEAVGRLVPESLRERLRSLLLTSRDRPELDADLRAELTGFYAHDRERVAELLGRRPPW